MVSRCFGESGKTPSRGTRPKVVFNPRMPQHAAGTRIEPAVSEPNATSAVPFATATADPLDEPPGIRRCARGLTGVPKYPFRPETPKANSVRLDLPTMWTFLP